MSIASSRSIAQVILVSPNMGKHINKPSITSLAVTPAFNARVRYWRKPASVCAATLVITDSRARVFGSRCVPAAFMKRKYEPMASGLAFRR